VTEASALGVSRDRTRARDLITPFRGVRAPASIALSLEGRARAYSERMSRTHHFSHETAAAIHGLPLPQRVGANDSLHVTAQPPARPPRMVGVIGHRPRASVANVVTVRGLRVSNAVATWCDLAATLDLDALITMGDALVRRQKPFATIEDLERAIAIRRGLPGASRLREALPFVSPGVDSPRETQIRLILVRAGLPEPEVNPRIHNRYGASIGFADMLYRSQRVIIEYDGQDHFEGQSRMLKDIDRLDEFMEEKYRVIRFNKSHLGRRAFIVGKVRTALEDRG